MRLINMHAAKANLSRIVDAAIAGEQVIIAKAGKPLVKIVSVGAEEAPQRTGFLAGQGRIPDNFDTRCSQEITELFEEQS